MDFNQLLKVAQGLPVVDSRVLSLGRKNSLPLKVQISRWVKSGRLIQLKRGIYLLAEPFRKTAFSEFYIANILKTPSYVSMEKAMEFYGLIPEAVRVYTSVTTKRPQFFETPVGNYAYQHVKSSLFWGYTSLSMDGQTVFMAAPEKALLDFFYLKHVKATPDYLKELRLQNLENIKPARLLEFGRRFNKKGMRETAESVAAYIKEKQKRNAKS